VFDFACASERKTLKPGRAFIALDGFFGTMSTNVNPAVSPDTAILEHVSALEEATNNFHYKDESVTLSVGDQVFSVRSFL